MHFFTLNIMLHFNTIMSLPTFKTWILAARPKTLAAGLCPVFLGICLAASDGVFHLSASLAALFGAIFIQIGTNFANDYFDFKKGADTADRLGPTRVTQAGLVTERQILVATALAFSLASMFGIYLIFRGGLPIIAIGIASILSGILYTGGPYPLGYLGLGELFVWLFFGPIAVAGTYFVQAQRWDSTALIVGGIAGLFSMAILAVNNYRDRAQDATVNKRTLAVRFGPTFAKIEYIACIGLGFLLPPILWGQEHPLLWGLLLGLPVSWPVVRQFLSGHGIVLNPVLAKTGLLFLVFTTLFCLGWLF